MSDMPPNVPPNDVPPVEPPYVPQDAGMATWDDNDRLMAALAYLFTPIVPLIILLVDSMKVRPYQRYHAIQSLGLGIVAWVYILIMCTCGGILTAVIIGFCLLLLAFLGWVPMVYYAYLAYAKPSYFEIPMLTKFMQQQGWLK